jgi:hypothetical protein
MNALPQMLYEDRYITDEAIINELKPKTIIYKMSTVLPLRHPHISHETSAVTFAAKCSVHDDNKRLALTISPSSLHI